MILYTKLTDEYPFFVEKVLVIDGKTKNQVLGLQKKKKEEAVNG